MKIAATVLTLIVAIGGFWLVSDWFETRSEVTVHRMFCTATRVNGECRAKEETANPTTYKIFVDQQVVVYWAWNGSDVSRYTFCAVRDLINWSCKFEAGEVVPTREYKMIDGEFEETAAPPRVIESIFYPVSRWHWWRVWLSEKLSGQPK